MIATNIEIYSNRLKNRYEVNRFSEYRVDIDLETDADEFNMVLSNPGGVYTGVFNKFDPVDVKIGSIGILKGSIDTVEYDGNEGGDTIQVIGRDICGILIDNDALPTTKNHVVPHTYIANKCKEYGIAKTVLDNTVPAQDKLIIGTGETEISIMQNLIVENHRRLWTIYDTLYMGKWNYTANPSYFFSRGIPLDGSNIPIKTINLRDTGLDMKSEAIIYGSANDGKDKLVGKAKNDYLVSQGIRKRAVMRSYNNDSSSKYSSNALEKIREDFRSGMELTVTIATGNHVVLPNRTAHVVDVTQRINSIFFIKGVKYSKSVGGGSVTTITMVPGDSTFDVIWKNQADKKKGKVTGLPTQSLTDLLKSRK